MVRQVQSAHFENDSIIEFNPISFAGIFVREMRKTKGLANTPSVRTTIAIPRFLSARYWRKENLDPMDYYEAAVYNTPFEDQHIARKIAYSLLFPKQDTPKPGKNSSKSVSKVDNSAQISGLDQIMSELSNAGFDDLLDLMDDDTDLEDLVNEQQDAWNFLEELLPSEDLKDKARLELLQEFSTEYSVVHHYLNNRTLIDTYLEQLLRDFAGTWQPKIFHPSFQLEMGQIILRYAQMPWEIATAMGLKNDPGFDDFRNELLQNSDAYTLGRTLRYLKENNLSPTTAWQNEAFSKISSMADYYEILRGIKEFRPPQNNIIEHGGRYDIGNSLGLAEKIAQEFGEDLSWELFDQFREHVKQHIPTLKTVQDATYDDGEKGWEEILEKTVEHESKGRNHTELAQLAKDIANHLHHRMNTDMKRFQTYQAKEIATQSLEKNGDPEKFLAELEHLIEQNIFPYLDRTITVAKNLGIPEEQIAELFEAALQVLQAYVESNLEDKSKYDRIVRKIHKTSSIPQELMENMIKTAFDSNNSIALGALGSTNLGQAMQIASSMQTQNGENGQEMLINSLDKGIGGGTNLLQQWFIHRRSLPKEIKERLKHMMREILLEIGMDWANRGTGSSEEGIIPEIQTRPYRPGDELDLVDIEATLDTLMMSGKTLQQITSDELMVTETSKGKTALGVLIDISGSMSGKNLAMCAIAVVMLLGRMEAKEVAIALFESNTHQIKGFNDPIELDSVADELLDLQATGGTRASAAINWLSEEFEQVNDAEVKIMYFLSDFYLSERELQLTQLLDPMVSLGVKMLGAHHGQYQNQTMQHMIGLLEGSTMEIKDFEKLPHVISDSISNLI